MIPLELSISGLYSYQKKQTINFRRLLDGQIFGIFGAVGSGKSSILEAITYALYGESERLNKQDKRNYNMMNLKSDALAIDFIFRNFDGKDYRFTVQVKRHGSKFEEVRSAKRQAYKKEDGNWVPLPHTDATNILGLSYENFRRTIIIPQGKFQEFLQLGDKARTDMLKEIFHLDKFEFYYQTVSLEKKTDEKIQHLEGQLSHFTEASKETIAEKEKELSLRDKELKTKQKLLYEKEKAWNKWMELDKIIEEQKELDGRWAKLEKQKPVINEKRKLIDKYEQALQHFKGPIERLKEWEESIAEHKKEKQALEQKRTSIQEELKKLEAAWPALEKSYQELDQRKAERDDFNLLIEAAGKQEDHSVILNRVEKSRPVIKETSEAYEATEKTISTLKKEIDTLKKDQKDMKELFLGKQWVELGAQLTRLKQRQDNKVKSLQKRITSLLPFIDEKWSDKSALDAEARLAELQLECEEEINQLQERLSHFQLDARLGEFVDRLKEGKPCPLCGAEEHPDILSVKDVSRHIESGEQKLKELREKVKAIRQALQATQETEASLSALKDQHEETEKRMEPIREKMPESWLESRSNKTVADIDRDIEQAEMLQEKLEKKVKEWEKALAEQENLKKSLEKYKEGQLKLERKADQIQTEINTLLKQLKVLQPPSNKDTSTLKTQRDKLEQTIHQINQQYEQTRKTLESHRQENHLLDERLKKLKASLRDGSEKRIALEKQIEEKLANSDFNHTTDVTKLLDKEIDVEAIKKEIQAFDQQAYSTQQELKKISKQLEGKDYNPEVGKAIKTEYEEAKQAEEQARDVSIRTRTILEKLQRDLAKKTELEKEKKALDHRKENLKDLKNIFKGSGFVNYISSVYLHNLCEAANERFYSLTRQQLRLEVDENNSFQVRDFMNDGRLRSVKTLSGGQTFQASLSLALALAESVQEQNQAKQNFFFLDEGFGALDEDALQVVFDTLKALRREQRIVGVISHVDALQQEIDMYLHIENDHEKGSIIEASWKQTDDI